MNNNQQQLNNQNNQLSQNQAWIHPNDSHNNLNNYTNNNFYYNQNNDYNKKKNNKKLIIIIILVVIALMLLPRMILIITSVKNTNNLLSETRKNTFYDNVASSILSINTDFFLNNNYEVCYNLNEINQIIEKPLINGPFGKKYSSTSYIIMRKDKNYSYANSMDICIVDEAGNGMYRTNIKTSDISNEDVKTNVKCNLPTICK